MALIDPQERKRQDIPNEPGQWVEFRPMTARDFAVLQKDAGERTPADIGLAILARCVTGWSYEQPVTAETLDQLDFATMEWLRSEISLTSGRDDDELKESEPESSPTTDPATDDSPQSSGT